MLITWVYLIVLLASMLVLLLVPRPFNFEESATEESRKVSIIIPARNEETNIGRCIESLTQQTYANTEIIVVDGRSEDRTREIAASFIQVTVVDEPERPEGWVGKPWACYHGYQQASGDILLFTDADTYHTPDALRQTVKQLQSSGLVTVLTSQEFKSFWEHMLTIVFFVIGIATNGSKGTDRTSIANGQYMLFERSLYEQLGTHKLVAGSIIEDLEFGTKAAKQGYPPLLISKSGLIFTRMYTSLGEILEGFGKNLALGMGIIRVQDFVKVGLLQFWGMGVLLLPLEILIDGSLSNFTIILALVGYLSHVLFLTVSEKWLTTSFSPFMVLYPVYYVVFWYVILYSVISTYLSKEIVWKGNKYTI
ncbi:MAG: glycosyltransferase [Candidatus Kariarchaeaceae archaeon]